MKITYICRICKTIAANIRLEEDVSNTSFVYVFRRRVQDVLIKRNIFALVISLQKTTARRLQDVLGNIFVLVIRLLDAFKTFSRGIIKLNCFC